MEHRLSDFFNADIAQRAGYIETYLPKQDEEVVAPSPDPLVTGLAYDSRTVKPGNLYFALPGQHTDGHTFIPDAIHRGASVIIHQDVLSSYHQGTGYLRVRDTRFAMSAIADGFYGSPSRHMAIIGVTGTEGKSTTVYLVYQLLRLLGKKAGFVSTVQYGDGEAEYWNPEHQTTPEATTVHKLLAAMRDHGAAYAVLEASSHGLSPRTNRLGDVAFDVGIITNVTHEHLEFHGTWEQYRADKANLFRSLDQYDHHKLVHTPEPSGAGSQGIPVFGVVNGDDPSAGYFAAATRHKTYTYSTRGAEADLSLQNIEDTAAGNHYRVLVRRTGKILEIQDRLPGAFNAGNVLAALLTLSELLGVPVNTLIPLVSALKPVRGRMTRIQQGQPFEVLVDYAHTPSSFETIFPPLWEQNHKNGGRIISLFGSAGERDTKKRSEQGRIASHYSDIVILTDEDPRGEVPLDILEAIAAGIPQGTRGADLFLIPDRPAAIRKAFSLAKPKDVVLLLGKGHENSIIYADAIRPYDEITEAEQALGELGFCRTITGIPGRGKQ
ncbi:MAG: UDP-N-acetylmuramoyl-L-alanyl-D-glutamate--2,6-diaminopimelate ligase [Treponema sp.]|jgi:UDP-N-acetylmuramoyl-L-alanyl-D-glutamate--2,6-diaminopimelate ligase|nr:UDP-N-acetylmuramoyl-L-alanyl-D-glutamate--2,6-diaminopimelate ligase [Treponema sp.]